MNVELELGAVRLVSDGIYYAIERYVEVGFWKWKRREWRRDHETWTNRTEAQFHFERAKCYSKRGKWVVVDE